jgi:predicted ATPase/DNA-binding SARP family transcriptional activator
VRHALSTTRPCLAASRAVATAQKRDPLIGFGNVATLVASRARYLAGMEIRILGPIEAYADGDALPLGGMRERALLTLFALSPGETISTDRLIDQLWGEDLPTNPSNALQALISRLRRAIGPDSIVTRAPGYVLDIPPDGVDATRFRSIVNQAVAEPEPAVRSRLFAEALSLWRGPALVEFPFEEFAQRESAALEELRVAAVEGRITADLELGGGAGLVPELEELVAAHPLRESLRASQMLALYRAGRQADALRAYRAAREVLGEELGIEPGPDLRALEESILMQDPGLHPSSSVATPALSARLPARLASFVGRDEEKAEVVDAFAASRLVTLTGAGGVGKTSLAVEVGRSVEPEYPDGVWLVELAPLTEPARVADAVVTALHLEQVLGLAGAARPEFDAVATVVEYLRARRVLLILDNCEHVVEAAAAVAEAILLACPSVDVLATSRDRLGIPGEVLWRVPSLGIANGSSDAIRLFVDRAQAVNPSFLPDAEGLAQVADICRRVDGMPLAIELAAARVRSLPLAEIAQRLDSDIGILSGGARHAAHRQQTLRATIDWSYQFLEPKEADLFAELSVFHGSFTLQGAEAVASPEVFDAPEVLGSLERLIDSSMVAPISVGAAGRYLMLETLRVYAGEKLAEAESTNAALQRLRDYFLRSIAPVEDALRGPDQLVWLDRLEADHDTIRAVLDWGVDQAPEEALRLAGMLGWFWHLRGSATEARERLTTLLAASGPDADPRARADAHFFGSLCDSAPEHVREGFQTARDVYKEAGHVPGVVNAQAMVAAWGFDMAEPIALLEESAELAASVGYEWGVALIRFLQAGVASVGNDNEAAIRLAEEAAARFAALGDSWGQGYSLYSGGTALRAMGEYDKAEVAFREALEHARPMRLRREMAPVMSELASIAMMRDDFDEAERWLADAQRYADEVPFAGSQGMVRNARGRLARLRGDLDEALRLHREAIALYARGDAHGGLAYSYSCAGFTEEMRGNLDAARSHHHAALGHARHTGDVFAMALALEGLGATLVAAGESAAGVRLLSASLEARERAGTPLPPGEYFDVDRACAAASTALDAAEFANATEAGRGLRLEAAVELASE